jgi:hypothetical protein
MSEIDMNNEILYCGEKARINKAWITGRFGVFFL